MSQRVRFLLWLVPVAAVLMASTVVAQKQAEDAIGFNAERLYELDNLDAVSVFGGNLTLTLPLPRYAVSSTLSYGLALVYNVKSLDWESWWDPSVTPPVMRWEAHPSLGGNAGLGWRVTGGRLYPPGSAPVNRLRNPDFWRQRLEWTYEGPAGDEHSFISPYENSSAVLLSIDQAALRLVKVEGEPYPTRDVQFPSGEIHRFQQINTDWRLTGMRDRFGTRVAITYEFDPLDTKRAKKWFIEEYVDEQKRRTHTLSFTHYPTMAYASASRGMQLTAIEVTAQGGTTATYGLTLTPTVIRESAPGSGMSVPLLTTFTLPDPDGAGPLASETYTFEYGADGLLTKSNYPTGGSTSYTYQYYQFSNTDDVCFESPWGAVGQFATPGIKTRTVSDGTTSREWKYVQRRGPKVELAEPHVCDGSTTNDYGPFYWARTSVLSPKDAANKRSRTDYYFDIFGGLNPHERPAVPLTDNPAGFSELSTAGMPPAATAKGPVEAVPEETAGYPADVSASDGTRFMTSQTYSGCDAAGDCTSGTLLRSAYSEIAAPSDYNRPHKSVRTVYEDDSGCGAAGNQLCESIVTMSGNNGMGLYTTETLSDNFGSALADRGVAATLYKTTWSSADRLDSGKHWIREIYTEKTQTENGVTVKTLFDFDSDTGRLKAQRSLKGSGLASDDTLTLFGHEPAASANNFRERIIERSFGGFNGGLGTSASDPFATPASSSIPRYIFRHSLSSGVRSMSEHLKPTATCSVGNEASCETVLTPLHHDIDASTGLVTASYDVSGVGVSYAYDRAFRFTTTTLPTGVTKSYTYGAAQATETTKNGAGTILGTSIFDFDGLGRVKRSSSSLANGKVAVVEIEYDELGRKARVSQPVEADSHPTTSIATDWTTTAYDSFGRPTSIKPPDHSAANDTETRIAYTGVRKVERTSQVATSLTATAAATTTETLDGSGRVVGVEEKTGGTSSTTTSGANVKTTYGYTIGGRLTSVTMQEEGGTPQTRTFSYDSRGFLSSETHAESGTTTYSEHDPRGHAGKRVAGGRTTTFTFDAAARLTAVAEQLTESPATFRPLKEFVFADANTDSQSRRGKLQTAINHNVLPNSGKLDVTETYEYDTAGRVSKRTTDVSRLIGTASSQIRTFDYSTTFDDFSQPKILTMPTCAVTGCGNALSTVTFNRTAGFLTSVSGLAELTYWPSGMIETVKHSSTPAATDTYLSVKGMPRPSKITFGGGEECLDITASAITAADAVCAGSAGNAASVAPRTGINHEWQISAGGTITSPSVGNSITFTAPHTGVITLTVTARDACGVGAVSTKTIALLFAPTAPTITAPASVCGASTGHTASVPASGATHTWEISGGTITSPTGDDSVTFTAGASGNALLTVTASRCGSTVQSSKTVAITPLPTATITGTTVLRGQPAALTVNLTGAAPWSVKWRDMSQPVTINSSPFTREITPSPTSTTMYWIDTVSYGGCTATVNASGVVQVLPPPPISVTATTRENRIIDLSWSPVPDATAYLIERTTLNGGFASWTTIVSATATAYVDTAPATTTPVTYIYYVRTMDGETSPRGTFDFATAATTMYEQPTITSGVTTIRAMDVVELRRGIDAFRAAFGVGAAFGSASPPSGFVRASHFTELVTALNAARTAVNYPAFQYSVSPAIGGIVLRVHLTELREALR